MLVATERGQQRGAQRDEEDHEEGARGPAVDGEPQPQNWEIPRCLGWQHFTILHLTYLSVGGVGYIVEHWDIE
jgi:hypothetical protein